MHNPIVLKGAALNRAATEFLDEVSDEVNAALGIVGHSAAFREIFRVALAAESTLSALRHPRLRPNISAVRKLSGEYQCLLRWDNSH